MLSRFRCVQLFVTLWNCSLPLSSVHGVLQTRILEWIAMSSSRWVLLYKKKNLNGGNLVALNDSSNLKSYTGFCIWSIYIHVRHICNLINIPIFRILDSLLLLLYGIIKYLWLQWTLKLSSQGRSNFIHISTHLCSFLGKPVSSRE